MGATLVALVALTACRNDDLTTTTRPPLAGVRYIHAVNDTSRLDMRMVDQLEYSANTITGPTNPAGSQATVTAGLVFREGTEYFPVEAKARRIKVFSLASATGGLLTADVVQQVLHDTTITFEANRNYTLLYTGSARANTDRFVVIEDAPPATVATTQIAMRVYNASGAPVDGYLGATATTALSATPAFAGVGSLSASSYVTRDTGAVAIRVTAAGSRTAVTSLAAATGTPGSASVNPVAGAGVGGTVFTAYVFPASVTGSQAPQTAAFLTQGVQLFLDKLPPNTIQ